MANSRLHKIGTIYSRVTGLLQSGAMKFEDKPMWYKIYQSFPPKYQPRFDRLAPNIELKKIFYADDVIRAKFHKKYPKHGGVIKFSDESYKSNTHKCIETYEQYKDTMSEDEILAEVIHKIESDTSYRSSVKTVDESSVSLARSFKKVQNQNLNQNQKSVNIADVFKDG